MHISLLIGYSLAALILVPFIYIFTQSPHWHEQGLDSEQTSESRGRPFLNALGTLTLFLVIGYVMSAIVRDIMTYLL